MSTRNLTRPFVAGVLFAGAVLATSPPAAAQDSAGSQKRDSVITTDSAYHPRDHVVKDSLKIQGDSARDTLGFREMRQDVSDSIKAPNAASVSASAAKNVFGAGMEATSLTTWTRLVEAAGMTEKLKGDSYTVFAPIDAAFDNISSDKLDVLLADKTKAAAVVSNHIVSGKVLTREDITASLRLKTLSGKTLPISYNKSHSEQQQQIHIGRAHIVQPDIPASNGVIHGIDAVLFWPK